MNALVSWALDLFYPPKCMLCGRLLESSGDTLCGKCGQELPEYDGPLRTVPMIDAVVAPFFYEPPIRDAILRFKFHGMQGYAGQFAKWMAVWVRDHLEGKYDLITWVPCSRRRRWTRGFDQAELLARALAAELNGETVCTLRKIRHNPKQSRTANAARRRANVLGVYEAVNPSLWVGKRILLVDDVVTTGATASECAKVLRMAGAAGVVCAAIAVTGPENK